MARLVGPTRCLCERPYGMSIRLNGRYINLTRVHEETGIDLGYLSRVIASKRPPSARCAQQIATALGMSTDDFLQAVDDLRVEKEKDYKRRIAS